MGRGVNKVILVGKLGQDPEIRYNQNGGAIANISLATSEAWKDKNTGEKKEKTEWHRVVVFGKVAEVCGEYLRKGSEIYIEGKLQTRKWQDQSTGQDRYATEVVVDFSGQVQMLGGKSQGQQPQQQAGGFQPQPQQQQQQQQAGGFQPQQQRQTPKQTPEPSMDFDDDIPF